MKQITFTRESFYNLVWSKSITKLSKEYRISASDLRKICKHYEVPTPLSGYWHKIKHNKPTYIINLPEGPKECVITLIERGLGDEDIPFFINPFNKRVYELQNDQSINLKVPLKLKNPHALIVKTKRKLEELDQISTSNYEIKRRIYQDILPIHTNVQLRNRALRIMNTLVTYVYQQNHAIVFDHDSCSVEMFGQRTEINLRQKVNRIRTADKDSWNRQDWVRSNNLEFQAGPSFRRKCWIDKENKKLETYIPNILAWIEQDCKYWHDLRKRQAEKERIREIKRLEEQEKRQLLKLEKEKRDSLINDSKKWNEAEILRSYINAVMNDYENNNSPRKKKENWSKWAYDIADSIDPLK